MQSHSLVLTCIEATQHLCSTCAPKSQCSNRSPALSQIYDVVCFRSGSAMFAGDTTTGPRRPRLLPIPRDSQHPLSAKQNDVRIRQQGEDVLSLHPVVGSEFGFAYPPDAVREEVKLQIDVAFNAPTRAKRFFAGTDNTRIRTWIFLYSVRP